MESQTQLKPVQQPSTIGHAGTLTLTQFLARADGTPPLDLAMVGPTDPSAVLFTSGTDVVLTTFPLFHIAARNVLALGATLRWPGRDRGAVPHQPFLEQLRELYGMTETGAVTMNREGASRPGSGGRPLEDCQVAIVGVPDPISGEEVAAFVQLQPDAAAGPAALLDHCAAPLPSFAVPPYLITIHELPRNTSQRVQKHRLPGPALADLPDHTVDREAIGYQLR